LALIAALDTDGKVYFALTHANTDSEVMCLFLRHLARQLSLESPNWRSESVILLDNASWHKSEATRAFLRRLQVPVMFSAQYSYSAASIELLFGGLKTGRLKSDQEPTGKK
jgi:transposase